MTARRDSYELAVQKCHSYSTSVSLVDHSIRSSATVHHFPSYSPQNQFPPRLVRSPNSEILLKNAVALLDSPVHAFLPRLQPQKTSDRASSLPTAAGLFDEDDHRSSSSPSVLPNSCHYRTGIHRSLASIFALASLFTMEILQISLLPAEDSFPLLFTFQICSSISSVVLALYASYIERVRSSRTISGMLFDDRCSRLMLSLTTALATAWMIGDYFRSSYRFLLLCAGISGICVSCMNVKTADHLLQLSSFISLEKNFKILIFIHQCLYQVSCTLGGCFLLPMMLFDSKKPDYILMITSSCLSTRCAPTFYEAWLRLSPSLVNKDRTTINPLSKSSGLTCGERASEQ